MSGVLCMLNLKGGVGKTVSCINIAASLAERGKNVLIVDTDSQGNIATALGLMPDELDLTLADLMTEAIDGEVSHQRIADCIKTVGNLNILPSNSLLAGIDYKLANAFARETVLNIIIDKVRADYDFIIIDCPPSLGLIVINALTAADYALIPVEAHYLSFESLKVMLSTINTVKLKLNPDLKVAGIFITMYQSRTNLSKAIKDKIFESYGDDIKVFDEYIPYSIKAAEQTLYGKSLIELYPSHPISEAYKKIAKELMICGR